MSRRTSKVTLPPVGPDIDLDEEEVLLPDGTRLTEAKAGEMAEEAMQRHYRECGRPSITGGRQHTPAMTVRVTTTTRTALERIAEAQGRRLADVSRDALDEYVRRHAV